MIEQHSITKLLVANRGEIAARVMRTAHALGVGTVAVYSDPDADAPFVALADEAVRLPGATPTETYLRGDLVIAAARATGADAVHPGYGFLSENAGFARDCAAAGLTFVGPTPDAIASMGSKLEAKALMAAAGVPVLPGATVTDSTDLSAVAEEIGFPVLVKAAFGGGGRGMRIVRSAAELRDAVDGARREAASAFGDGTVFLERFVEDPRHVEVQIVGDTGGEVVHLFERECSIQRRYQKIVEESPSPAVDETLRAELGAAAVAAGKAIGYTGAGTVEFVLEQGARRCSFFFLEVNTRLQVEHPVTELVTGLDLVALQLRIAEGHPLPAEVLGAAITGHAIEVRLYAEDVPAGYLPATGTLHRFAIPALRGVRVDAGVTDGSVVSPHYDPMLAKVIAHGATRAEAARTLARALAQAAIHGVTTNRDLLVGILRDEEFLAGRTDTGYLPRHPELRAPRARRRRGGAGRGGRARAAGTAPERREGARRAAVGLAQRRGAAAVGRVRGRRPDARGDLRVPTGRLRRPCERRCSSGRRDPFTWCDTGCRDLGRERHPSHLCRPPRRRADLRRRTRRVERLPRRPPLRRPQRRRARRVAARAHARDRHPGARGHRGRGDRGRGPRRPRGHEDGAHGGGAGRRRRRGDARRAG